MKTILSVLALSLCALLCPQLDASSFLPACVAGSLASYEASSGCVLGGGSGGVLVFSGFASSVDNPDSVTVLDPSEIELTPEPSGLGGSFDFSGDFSVPAGDRVTYNIDYFLLIDPAPILGGGSLHLDPTGNVSFTESICADSSFGTDGNGHTVCVFNSQLGPVDSSPQSFSVDNSNPPFSLSKEFNLNPAAYNFATVQTAIVLTGGTSGASSGGVVVGDTVTTAAPEPVTSLLCLGGLIAIGIFRRRLIV
jgi:hypothetical protein